MESLRNLGYSLGAAIADLIDNSITASASRIDIFHDLDQPQFRLAILDNGLGMEREELLGAMRMGSSSPLDPRCTNDMGRFGLGMKTASFSQARRFTVITRKNDVCTGARWDLDNLDKRWKLEVLDDEEIEGTTWSDSICDTGTMILLEKLDRLGGKHLKKLTPKIFLRELDLARDHLSLVFHRYLAGQSASRISININNYPIQPYDPFFKYHQATQPLNGMSVKVGSGLAEIKPYIIPHFSKLKGSERDVIKKYGGQSKTQGFYVYRNRRLLAWGSWFGLKRQKRESSALARIQIDISNAMDHQWGINIMKSKVFFPEAVKSEMRVVLDRIEGASVRTYTSRGQKISGAIPYPFWQREVSNSGVKYLIDHEHPLLKAFAKKLPPEVKRELSSIFSLIGEKMPLEAIYNDRLGDNIDRSTSAANNIGEEKYQQMLKLLLESGYEREQAENILKHSFKEIGG
ncbi:MULTISPECIES: ATP-binding protein [unclassified Maridesulfovibrio]|uniref:ATP-binding protein n=1 Tax=unclassified Maridesulfovibrio TaxID=2794999 RepID=UPI003B40C259